MIDIIGIDCSTNPKKLGIARGQLANGELIILEASVGHSKPHQVISSWLQNSPRAIIALDAPLGWPKPMGASLSNHLAGSVIQVDSNLMFRRHTDRFIKRELNKQSLDVGANLIARTALFALKHIDSISKETGKVIPMAWSPDFPGSYAAIEVYPAATLESRGIDSSGYKKPEQLARRQEILALLGSELELNCESESIVAKDDTLDAVLCVLAAADFLNGQCYKPAMDKKDVVEVESWIWVKRNAAI